MVEIIKGKVETEPLLPFAETLQREDDKKAEEQWSKIKAWLTIAAVLIGLFCLFVYTQYNKVHAQQGIIASATTICNTPDQLRTFAEFVDTGLDWDAAAVAVNTNEGEGMCAYGIFAFTEGEVAETVTMDGKVYIIQRITILGVVDHNVMQIMPIPQDQYAIFVPEDKGAFVTDPFRRVFLSIV